MWRRSWLWFPGRIGGVDTGLAAREGFCRDASHARRPMRSPDAALDGDAVPNPGVAESDLPLPARTNRPGAVRQSSPTGKSSNTGQAFFVSVLQKLKLIPANTRSM